VAIRTALVVGAGIAGSTCAYFLSRSGVTVTVVERAGAQRSSGSPVDVRGPALAVVDRMHLLPQIRAAATSVSRLVAVDGNGRAIGWIPTQASRTGIELPRQELCTLLSSAASEYADFRYDDTVTGITEVGAGVDVTFERAAPGRFDLVVGADGLHSTIRRLVFGPDRQFVSHLGLCIATAMLDRPSKDAHTVLVHSTPGRAVFVHPTTGREGCAFIFRHPALSDDERTDPGKQERLLAATYQGARWRVPELLESIRGRDDLYVDNVSRVELERWSRGRILLVGDAANCVSLLGEGSSMAIVGAAGLARGLAGFPAEVGEALGHYERLHRRRLRPHHIGASVVGHVLVPASRAGITARDAGFRLWAAVASQWGRRGVRARLR